MKIINSHYIPLPAPYWLIVTPEGSIYEQIGTMSVVEDASTNEDEYGIKTHNHPVVVHSSIENSEVKGGFKTIYTMLTHANGKVLDKWRLEDCTPLCLSKDRSLNYMKLNVLHFRLTRTHYEDFIFDDFLRDLNFNAIKVKFPDKKLHEIHISTFHDENHPEYGSFLINDLTELLFLVPFWADKDEEGIHIKWDDIFMEYVNQARTYLKINPKYRFHFNSALEIVKPLVERLNNELNDYLERKEE